MRNGLSGGGREWSPLRCATLRWPAAPGAQAPGGAALAGSPRLQLGLVPSDWQCVAPERVGILEVLEAPCSPAWGSPFVHFAPPGEGSDFAFSAASSAGAASGRPDWGNSRRCHGTRHLLRGAASRGTRPRVRSIPFCAARRGDLRVLQLTSPAPPGLPLAPLNRGPES